MPRYFIELAYRGTKYSGFQVQENANTIQSEVEKAFQTLHRTPVSLTGSSRTDAGVHALQNYFHFDFEGEVHPQFRYKMNAILPDDIVIRHLHLMPAEAHSRFDALGREYVYKLHRFKDPFKREFSYFYPYKLDIDLMHQAAAYVKLQTNFFAFSKTNTQVKNFNCQITKSEWVVEGEELFYHIGGNRFLRGMVRLLTATLLKVGRHKLSFSELEELFEGKRKCGFSVPSHGLYLVRVAYPENFFP
jgi:tRNA pseudouridine38-40 synthase